MLQKIQTAILLLFITLGFVVGGVYAYKPEIINNLWAKPNLENAQAQVQEHAVVPALPAKIVIPKLGVEANIEFVGADESGRMGIPEQVENAGWWKYGAKPGEVGSAVLAGHVDTPEGSYGIFYKLDQLMPGDTITVYDQENNQHVFRVAFVQTYQEDEFPVDVVFERADKKRLNLITCSGNFDLSVQNYEERLVVFAEAIE